MSRVFVCAVLLVSIVVAAEASRALKDMPNLDIQVGNLVKVSGGNGQPLQVLAPGTGVQVDTKKTPCGDKTKVDVIAPYTSTNVKSGDGCEPAKVDVTAPGTTVAASG